MDEKHVEPSTSTTIHVKENNDDVADDASDTNDVDKGYFGIVTYYVQMAAVIKIQIEFSDIDKSESFLDKMVENIGRFLNIELTQMTFDACPVVGLTTLGRHLYNLSFLFGIYMSWAGIFFFTLLTLTLMQRKGKTNCMQEKLKSFQLKLVGGLVEIIKYTYAGFCGIVFMSLVCVQIGTKYVWWYDATNVCLETWQILIVLFAVLYAVPLPFVFLWGMKLLKRNEISAFMFILCCLCPPTALYSMLLKRKCTKNQPEDQGLSPTSEASETIISVLQGPHREDSRHMTLYWESMVSIRRLLITAMTLCGYASIRMIIITTISLIFLLQHILLMPFQFKMSNYVEMLSLSLLLLTSVINLLKASLTDSGVVPSGHTVPFFKSLELGEKMFVLLIIACILLIELSIRHDKKVKRKTEIITYKYMHCSFFFLSINFNQLKM